VSCPKCGGEQLCPCKSCMRRNAGKVVWKWLPDGYTIACGHCGYTAHVDRWMDIEMKLYANKEP